MHHECERTIFYVILTLLVYFKPSKCGTHTDLRVLDQLLANYDRRATPSHHFNNATIVDCELFIRSFGFKDPSSVDYQVDLYFRQTWEDSRLNHANISQSLDLNDPRLVKNIWKPEVYFPNAKDASFEVVTVPNLLLRIMPHGKILYMLRLKLVFGCMMELSKFPLDSQICTMEVASFSKTVKELQLQWKSEKPVLIYTGLRMPQFEITKVVTTKCQETIQIGSYYSCLLVEFHMNRSIGFHLVQSYLPTVLFVVISWLSFWMDVDALLPRTSLGITTLLTVSSKSSALQGGVPQVSYIKAIDVWMGTCTAFVFCSLLELTIINCLWRKQHMWLFAKSSHMRSSTTTSFITSVGAAKSADEPSTASGIEPTTSKGTPEKTSFENCSKQKPSTCTTASAAATRRPKSTEVDLKLLARSIDAWCRVLFPLTFTIFAACYWCYYLQ